MKANCKHRWRVGLPRYVHLPKSQFVPLNGKQALVECMEETDQTCLVCGEERTSITPVYDMYREPVNFSLNKRELVVYGKYGLSRFDL